tara:strand:+ start:33609 stop:34313 length:705 start_codon:yes stop_codon:yes gene_type:complete
MFDPSKLKYEFKDFIGIFENAFTSEECDDAIKLFEKCHKMGYTYGRFGEGDNVLTRMDDVALNIGPSLELDWDLEFIKPFQDRYYEYIYPLYNIQYPALQNLQRHQIKYMKIQKTSPTQGYHVWHCEHDAYVENFGADHRERVLAWTLYLNDVEDGGETEFLYQSMRVKPKKGTFALWPAFFTHTHRGNPPLSGDKYIATGWVNFCHTQQLQGEPKKYPDLSSPSDPSKKMSYE